MLSFIVWIYFELYSQKEQDINFGCHFNIMLILRLVCIEHEQSVVMACWGLFLQLKNKVK
jgi:hypothetical protein